MFRILVLLFLIVPVIELWGLISVGKLIGPWYTVLLVIASGVIGAWLAKQQGLQVLRLVQVQLSRGQMPTDALLDGVLILVGAVLLLTPGFFTDLIGFVFLVPFIRAVVRHFFKRWLWSMVRTGRITFWFRR